MNKETKQKIEEFYRKYKTEIIVTGIVIGGVILAYNAKPKVKYVNALPGWARKWRSKCDLENLLYESGLPIFADDSYTIAYSDAFADEAAKTSWLADGFKIIDREVK